jgi:phenylalanyl-tRNA synthetase alpha chain
VADLAAVQEAALAAIRSATTVGELDEARVRFTGKRSELAAAQAGMRDLSPDERRTQGQAINAFKQAFEEAYEVRRDALAAAELQTRLGGERLDLTLPPRRLPPGRPHLLTQVLDEIVDVFVGLGYAVAEGPEAESATYNFDLMNIPADHPARQEMDTIYVATEEDAGGGSVVLRTHTSPVQARVMTTTEPPIAVVVPGRVFRADAVDATHSPVFHQVEGLLVDEGVTMADLRGTLLTFARAMFGPERQIRLRPSMFPFTEPSAEVDVSCAFCTASGAACRVCSGTGWIEILGAGMVDPAVLTACGIDPDRYSGFAFGVGAERVAMLRHGVTDIREFFEGDIRFLARF